MTENFQRVNDEFVSGNPIEIRPLQESDITKLEPILRQHIRDSETGEVIESEVTSVKGYMVGKEDEYGRTRRYLVARSGDQVLGCMAYSEMDPDMVKHFDDIEPDEAVELLNAFVNANVFRGGGVGKKLLQGVCDAAKAEGKKFLTIHSGPRYKKSWGFYDHLTDKSRGFIENKYGKGRHAKTWLKQL